MWFNDTNFKKLKELQTQANLLTDAINAYVFEVEDAYLNTKKKKKKWYQENFNGRTRKCK